jgi:U4/U6 small nuclear ribonucleoprotein PRP3
MDKKRKLLGINGMGVDEGVDSSGKKSKAEEKNVATVLEKARKALEMQHMLKERLKNIKNRADQSKDSKGKGKIDLSVEGTTVEKPALELISPEHAQEVTDAYFDPALSTRDSKGLRRKSRPSLQFVKEGFFQKQAETARLKAEFGEDYVRDLEERRRHEAQEAIDAGENPNLVPIGKRDDADIDGETDVPSVEWWDERILIDKSRYPDGATWDSLDASNIKEPKLTAYVEHPVELEPPIQSTSPAPAPLKLTRREMKKLRTQRRQAREAEKQELIRQGLLEPPKPKVKISNLMRVLGSESAADPTAIELEVSRQMAERQAAHEDRNLARMLTPAERREKKLKKLLDHPPGQSSTSEEIEVAVYKVKDLSLPQNRFKIQVNARENHLTGVAIIVPRLFSVIIVEGGPKTLRRYENVMLNRIKWKVPGDSEEMIVDEASLDNYCALVWRGIVAERSFRGKFRTEEVHSEVMGRNLLEKHGIVHYWDLVAAYSPE